MTRDARFILGEVSGDREGNDSSVFAELGATSECFRERTLTVTDLRDAVDNWEAVRSSLSLSVVSAILIDIP